VDSPCRADQKASITHWLEVAPAQGTPDAALGDAVLRSLLGDDDATTKAFETIARRWPADARSAWIGLGYCQKDRDCGRSPWVRRVLTVDSRNAYAWLAAMDFAADRGDEGGAALALRRATVAPEYRSPAGLVFSVSLPAFVKVGTPASCMEAAGKVMARDFGHELDAEEWAGYFAHGTEMAAVGVGYAALAFCNPKERGFSKRRTADCIAILTRMSTDPSLHFQIGANTRLINLLGIEASGPFRERYRELIWLQRVIGSQQHFPRDWLQRVWTEGEVPAWEAIAQADGLWPPPRGWLPEDQLSRRLILEGR
jgi:hypothetical protein